MSSQPQLPLFSPKGIQVVVEPSPTLPLVDLEIAFPIGASHDPSTKAGRTRMMTRLVQSGPRGMTANQTDDAFARLGARFGIETSMSSVRIRATVIDRKLPELLELVGKVISKPAFRKSDLERVRREALADLQGQVDNDTALATRVFREMVFGDHVYSRSIVGSTESAAKLTGQDLEECYHQVFLADRMTTGFAGPRSAAEFADLADKYLNDLPPGRTSPIDNKSARSNAGRHVVVVDKPDRAQVQVLIGGLGSRLGDPKRDALTVANAAFGGMFTSPLVQEVREKRGWSYGVGSRVGADRCRESWSMWSHPAEDQAISCIALQLRLLEQWVDHGVSQRQFRATQKYLINGHCFEVDTAGKRLDTRIGELVYGRPIGTAFRFPERVRAVTRDQANRAVQSRIDPHRLAIVVVGNANTLRRGLARLPGVKSMHYTPYKDVFSGNRKVMELAPV